MVLVVYLRRIIRVLGQVKQQKEALKRFALLTNSAIDEAGALDDPLIS
jgi:hypothetical protein